MTHSYKDGRTLPGGGLRRGELPVNGAARELREETGLRVDPSDLHLVDIVETRGRYGRRNAWVFEVGLPTLPQIRCNGWEIVSAQLCDPSLVFTPCFIAPSGPRSPGV